MNGNRSQPKPPAEGLGKTLTPAEYLQRLREAETEAEKDVLRYLVEHNLKVEENQLASSCRERRLDTLLVTD